MIQPKKINYQVAEHFDPNNNSLGFLNQLEHIDLRTQIAEQNISGYYIIIPDDEYHKINGVQPIYKIASNGDMEDWPVDFYSQTLNLFLKLYSANQENKNKFGGLKNLS